MNGTDLPMRRAIVLVGLMVLATVALRGYLPGVDRDENAPATGSGPGSLIFLIVLLAASIGVLALALVGALRQPRPGPMPAAESDRRRGANRPTRRQVLLILGLFAAAAIAVFALSAVNPVRTQQPAQQPPPTERQADSDDVPAPPQEPTGQPEEDEPSTAALVVLYSAGAILLGVAVVGAVAVARRARYPDLPAPIDRGDDDGGSPSESLVRAAELALADLAAPGREPRAAIIACYAAMERELAGAPDSAPLASDTPTEVLARAVGHGALHSDAAADLVGLFAEARFSPHRMTEAHRDAAANLLRIVLDDLRSPA